MTRDAFPSGFSQHAAFEHRLGAVQLASRSQPACLWIVATGYIGPSLLRRELVAAGEFGKEHSEGWSYVVDTRAVWAINPMNPVLLRRIPRLPNISRYVVIAPRWIRTLAPFGAMIVRPTELVATPSEALAAVVTESNTRYLVSSDR